MISNLNSIVFREYILHDFNPLKFVAVCFVALCVWSVLKNVSGVCVLEECGVTVGNYALYSCLVGLVV